MTRLMEQLKMASHVSENIQCKLDKSTVLDAIRAVRALEEIAIMPVGINWPAEATRMREIARDATK